MENFSNNERKIIKLLLGNGRMTDKEISKELGITPQACGKIRKKLEERAILVGYTCVSNLKKVGIETFAFLHMKFSSKFFKEFKDTDIFSKVAKGFGFLFCCVPSDPETSMIALLAFRSISEMDEYTKKLKVNLSEYFDTLHIIPFSIGNLLVFNPTNVLKLIVDGKKIEPITSLEKFRQM